MGKSLGNAIFLVDNDEVISKKIMSAITDPGKIKKDDPANPDVCMVYYYHNLVSSKEDVKNICNECKNGERGCVNCKKELIKNMIEFLQPIRDKRKVYESDPELVKNILENGTNNARKKAIEVVKNVKRAMKIDY